MKKNAFLLCLIYSLSSYSQLDFKEGFIINNSGETINGYVNLKENSSTYSICEFKKTLNGIITKYYPNKIIAYGFKNDKYFISKKIENKNVFLEILSEGKATLYKYNKEYYLMKDGVFKLLDNKLVKVTNENSRKYKKNSKKFIGILKVFLKDCNKIRKQLDNIKYTEKSLIKIITTYNYCVGSINKTYRREKKIIKVSFGISTGLNYAHLSYNHSEATFLYQDEKGFYFTNKSNSSAFFTAGFFTELASPRVNESFSLYAGLFYMKYNFLTNKITNNSVYEVSTKLNQLKIPLGIRYTFPKRNITPYITFGVSNYINLSSNTEWFRDVNKNNVIETRNINFKATNSAFGYFGSIGIKKNISKRIIGFIDIVYDNSKTKFNNIIEKQIAYHSKVNDYDSSISSLQLLIGIKF